MKRISKYTCSYATLCVMYLVSSALPTSVTIPVSTSAISTSSSATSAHVPNIRDLTSKVVVALKDVGDKVQKLPNLVSSQVHSKYVEINGLIHELDLTGEQSTTASMKNKGIEMKNSENNVISNTDKITADHISGQTAISVEQSEVSSDISSQLGERKADTALVIPVPVLISSCESPASSSCTVVEQSQFTPRVFDVTIDSNNPQDVIVFSSKRRTTKRSKSRSILFIYLVV